MKLKDLAGLLHRLAPPDLALDWDNSGLQVGDWDKPVTRVGLALDATLDTVARAEAAACDLLLTHHPLIFQPLKSLDRHSGPGAVIWAAQAAGLAVFSLHTNWDQAAGGVAGALADHLELLAERPLALAARGFHKLAVFVPSGYEERVKAALFEAGAGVLGDYERTWFAAPGEGGFQVPFGGRPFIGRPGEEARARESRLEVLVPSARLEEAALAVRAAHPYEEPAFEFQAVKIFPPGQGLGLLARWNPARDLFDELGRRPEFAGFKWAGPRPGRIERLALMPGSGGGYAALARRLGAEALLTGDVGYHQALEAAALGLTLVDMGHFETEWPGLKRLGERLAALLAQAGAQVACQVLDQAPAWRRALDGAAR
jgi:dinuclear metal center YbgI/SA1388 family protein